MLVEVEEVEHGRKSDLVFASRGPELLQYAGLGHVDRKAHAGSIRWMQVACFFDPVRAHNGWKLDVLEGLQRYITSRDIDWLIERLKGTLCFFDGAKASLVHEIVSMH